VARTTRLARTKAIKQKKIHSLYTCKYAIGIYIYIHYNIARGFHLQTNKNMPKRILKHRLKAWGQTIVLFVSYQKNAILVCVFSCCSYQKTKNYGYPIFVVHTKKQGIMVILSLLFIEKNYGSLLFISKERKKDIASLSCYLYPKKPDQLCSVINCQQIVIFYRCSYQKKEKYYGIFLLFITNNYALINCQQIVIFHRCSYQKKKERYWGLFLLFVTSNYALI
jgi:hypothetical protein